MPSDSWLYFWAAFSSLCSAARSHACSYSSRPSNTRSETGPVPSCSCTLTSRHQFRQRPETRAPWVDASAGETPTMTTMCCQYPHPQGPTRRALSRRWTTFATRKATPSSAPPKYRSSRQKHASTTYALPPQPCRLASHNFVRSLECRARAPPNGLQPQVYLAFHAVSMKWGVLRAGSRPGCTSSLRSVRRRTSPLRVGSMLWDRISSQLTHIALTSLQRPARVFLQWAS